MGAPESGMQAAEQPEADALLSAFRTIDPAERRRHAGVLNYWLSIRGDKEFPPLHDLDPLELSDSGPCSVLLELISGGHDAEIRHVGEQLKAYVGVDKIIEAPSPSLLACIAKKLPIVAISRDFLAFEDEYPSEDGATRCWVTLLPLSAGGAWVDYVYALVSIETVPAEGAQPVKKAAKKAKVEETDSEAGEEVVEAVAEPAAEPAVETIDEVPVEDVTEVAIDEAEEPEAAADESDEPESPAEAVEIVDEEEAADVAEPVAKAPGFSKLFDSLAGLTGFYGSQPVKVEPVIPAAAEADEQLAEEQPVEEEAVDELPAMELTEEPLADEQPAEELAADEEVAEETPEIEQSVAKAAEEPVPAMEGSLQSKLTEVRTKADEARMAKLRANAALYEGLAAAYDFALDAEDAPEEYLRLVEAQGLKIQLRAPMKPVVKLAFDGMCDDSTIAQLEAVLAWALKEELPRGTLAERLEADGGIAGVLNGAKKAA